MASERTRCEDCQADQPKRKSGERKSGLSADRRGYDANWRRLSAQARALQPFCSIPGCADPDLTGDHLRWPARSLDDVQVLCRHHNSQKGKIRSLPSTRRTSEPQGGHPPRRSATPGSSGPMSLSLQHTEELLIDGDR